VGAKELPTNCEIASIVLSGSWFCGIIVPIILVMVIKLKMITASVIDEKRFHTLSTTPWFSFLLLTLCPLSLLFMTQIK
jgi:hypothetical protein